MENRHLIYSLEDDEDIARIIKVALEKAGYEVGSFPNAKAFFLAFSLRRPEMVLLDLMLPDEDGMDILKRIRMDKTDNEVQVIIISAKRMLMDKVDGLDAGADDYIEKPFDILELISRVNARFRRSEIGKPISYKGLSLDAKARQCTLDGQEVVLTEMEFSLLALFMSRLGEAVSRDQVIQAVYGANVALETRAIDMHVSALRKKIASSKEGLMILTVRGIGYKLV
jgi:two-component system alkaline phosphatase synthesis response regulator PhoP